MVQGTPEPGDVDEASLAQRGQPADFAVVPHEEQVEFEHAGVARIIEHHRSLGETPLEGHAPLERGDEVRAPRRPRRQRVRKLVARQLHEPLRETPVHERAEELRRPAERRVGIVPPTRRRLRDPLIDERKQLLVRRARQVFRGEQTALERRLDEAHEGQRRGAHGVVPVDVAEHLVLREEERLQRAESLLADREFERTSGPFARDGERGEEAVDVHGPVRHAAEEGVAPEVVDLVEVQRSRDQPLQRVARLPPDEGADARRGIRAMPLEDAPDGVRRHEARRDLLVVSGDGSRTEFLQRVREGVVPDVVEERAEANHRQFVHVLRLQRLEVSVALETGDGPRHEMVDAEGVQEAVVDAAGIHEVGEAELLDAPQPLELGRVENLGRVLVHADVPPQGITDGAYSGHGRR